MNRIVSVVAALIGLLAAAALAVKLVYGGGAAYPDVGTPPRLAASALEPVVALDFPPGNVAIAADGRTFFAYHPFAEAARFSKATVFELVDGAPRPYPDAAFQSRYQGVFGMTVDRQNRLWLVESAGLDRKQSRLLAFDLSTNALVFEYAFPEKTAQFAQDLRVSPDGATLYIADTGLFRFTRPSLIVFDVATKTFRQTLRRDPSTQPQDVVTQTPFGPHRLAYGLVSFQVGLDGIALSDDGAFLYYGAMNNGALYKIPTAALRDPALSEADLARQVVRVGTKPLSDGIAVDAAGDVVLTDIEHGGLARMTPDGALETLVRSPKVVWADGVAVAPDGALVFTDSAIPAYVDQLARPPKRETLAAHAPYHLWRVRP